MYSNRQLRFLRARAHALKPVVRIGSRGVTPALVEELEQALAAHELLKLKVGAGGRDQRDALIAELCRRSGATLVQRVGHVAVLYRENEDGKNPIELPPA